MTDPIKTLTALKPRIEDDPEALARTRQNLVSTFASEPPVAAAPAATSRFGDRARFGGRLRPKWLVPAAAAATIGLATAATWGVLSFGNAEQSTNLECQVDTAGQAFSIIQAVTGDPVADCQAEWQQSNHTKAPAMVAYENGKGAVTVRLKATPAPDGSTKLPDGQFQQANTIKLEQYLGDVGSGLASECVDTPTAKARINAEFNRLGLEGWTITDAARGPADGAQTCATGASEGQKKRVRLFTDPVQSFQVASPAVSGFAKEIQRELASSCQSLDAAQATVHRIANKTNDTIQGKPVNLGADGLVQIIPGADPSQKCTTATTEVGGAILVTLRGPAN